MLPVLVTVATDTQNALHPSPTSSIIARHLLDFMVQGKITATDALTVRLNATPSGLSMPHLHHPPIFTRNALSAVSLAIYPGLAQAPNNVGLHSRRLDKD